MPPSSPASSKAVELRVKGDAVVAALLPPTPSTIKREDGDVAAKVLQSVTPTRALVSTHQPSDEPDGVEGLEMEPEITAVVAGSTNAPRPALSAQDHQVQVLPAASTMSEGNNQLGRPPRELALEQPCREGDSRAQSANLDEGFVQAEVERFRLEHAIETIDILNERIKGIERTEQRLKKQLRDEKERLKDSKAYGEGVLNLLVLAEEKVSAAETAVATLRCDVERYRGWWITEYYSLRALLGMLSRDQRAEARIIGQAAEERYAAWLNMQE